MPPQRYVAMDASKSTQSSLLRHLSRLDGTSVTGVRVFENETEEDPKQLQCGVTC